MQALGAPLSRVNVVASQKCFPPRNSSNVGTQEPRTPVKVLVDKMYEELNLGSLKNKVKSVRNRQHCNPLKAELMKPPSPSWEDAFSDPALPLTVDIGSGHGKFLLLLAKRNSGSRNYLGLDIREQLIVRSNSWVEELHLTNILFLTANATVSFDSLLSTYPGKLSFVTILCPDPQFKKRHRKRRIVQRLLVDSILRHISPGGKILIGSDVEEVATDMKRQFDEHLGNSISASFEEQYDCQGWLLENPVGMKTEREISVIANGGRMYRVIYKTMS